MAPMALGLTAALQESRPGLPVRRIATDVMTSKDTLHLRAFQEPAIQATGHWPHHHSADPDILDRYTPFGLVKGLPAVGYAPPYGVFPQQQVDRPPMDDVLAGWEQHNQNILNQLKPGKDDAFLLQESMEDATQCFCTPLMKRSALLSYIAGPSG